MRTLTQNAFLQYKSDYEIYGTHTETDSRKVERTVRDAEPRCTVHTMWHPVADAVSAAEYGPDITSMYYAIIYEPVAIEYSDVVTLFDDDEYEVVGIKRYNTHTRIDVKRKKV